jgi:hypothetical protein
MEKPIKVSDYKWSYRGYEIHAGSARHTSKRGAKYQYHFHTYEVAQSNQIDKPMMFTTKIIDNVVMVQKTHRSFSLDGIVMSIDQIKTSK